MNMDEYQASRGGLQPIQGGRKFYEIPTHDPVKGNTETGNNLRTPENPDPVQLAEYINSNIIGNKAYFTSPYGRRRVVYCDHIASGRSVDFIESYLR